MSSSFITPLTLMQPVTGTDSTSSASSVTGSDGSSIFKDVFQNAVSDVTTTEDNLANQEYLLATGQIDDAHTVPIAASQAQLSVDFLVQLRNKALDSYNQLMNMNI